MAKKSKKSSKKAASTPGSVLQVPHSSLHWHAHPLADIEFTSDGAYLVSGVCVCGLCVCARDLYGRACTCRMRLCACVGLGFVCVRGFASVCGLHTPFFLLQHFLSESSTVCQGLHTQPRIAVRAYIAQAKTKTCTPAHTQIHTGRNAVRAHIAHTLTYTHTHTHIYLQVVRRLCLLFGSWPVGSRRSSRVWAPPSSRSPSPRTQNSTPSPTATMLSALLMLQPSRSVSFFFPSHCVYARTIVVRCTSHACVCVSVCALSGGVCSCVGPVKWAHIKRPHIHPRAHV